MENSFIVAGSGGQGIMQLGRTMALCGMLEGYEVTCIPAYGPEMRGGTANCTVVISREEIGSPVVYYPKGLIAMNQPALDKFGSRVREGGVILINTSLVNNIPSFPTVNITLMGIDATNLAEQIGQKKAANMAALGAFIAHTRLFSLNTAFVALKQAFEGLKQPLIDLNIKALQKGTEELEAL